MTVQMSRERDSPYSSSRIGNVSNTTDVKSANDAEWLGLLSSGPCSVRIRSVSLERWKLSLGILQREKSMDGLVGGLRFDAYIQQGESDENDRERRAVGELECLSCSRGQTKAAFVKKIQGLDDSGR
jgi:hypothetical protein